MIFSTRMHSSRMCTACSLTVSHCILCMLPHNHASPPQPCMPPTTYTPQQPCMPPATMHASPQPCTPLGNHACPSATMHAPGNYACPPQPRMPPGNHTCPLIPTHAAPPATTHAPLATMHAPPWTEWHTCVKILPFHKLRLRAVKIIILIIIKPMRPMLCANISRTIWQLK